MLNTRFSRVTKNKRLIEEKNQLPDLFFVKFEKLDQTSFFLQRFNPSN